MARGCSRKLAGPLVCGGLSQESVQFLKIDRLGEIGVKPFFRCTPLVGVLTIAAYRDHIYAGQSGFFPQYSSDRIAVLSLQTDIAQHDLGSEAPCHFNAV